MNRIIEFLKYTIILFLIWFIINAGFKGIYNLYFRKLRKTTPDDKKGDNFGNIFFLLYSTFLTISIIGFANSNKELGYRILIEFLKISFIFFTICFVGLIYFFRHIDD